MTISEKLFKVFTPLLMLQAFHLIWLAFYMFGIHVRWLDIASGIVDYTEIPAIIGLTVAYLMKDDKRFQWQIALLWVQAIHIFWITDAVILQRGFALGYLAAAIDYLEVPVMIDSLRKAKR